MAKAASSFAFDDGASLGPNLAGFCAHLISLDAVLGADFAPKIASLPADSHDREATLDGLLEAVEAPPPSAATEAAGAPTILPLPSPQSAAVAVTGWLLEGVSIEGFRGINNQGKPLELEFSLNKINSVSAVNGVGKSSVYDAIRYAISGRLPWLDNLPATEREGDYYLNKFNSSGKATITLRLVAEPTLTKYALTVERTADGKRTVTSVPSCDADAILTALDREFVLLDGATFHNFMSAKPLDRGRTFSGLLGLSEYSALRQALQALANTKAFNGHFDVTAHAQSKAREEKAKGDAYAAIATDYEILVGQPLVPGATAAAAQAICHQALAQIGPIGDHCSGKTFAEIGVDECINAVKLAEGGPKRERLAACIRERSDLAKLTVEAPSAERAASLVACALERETVLAQTAGDVLFQLYRAGATALDLPEWTDPTLCPLCDHQAPHSLKDHVAGKLAKFDALDQATLAAATEWAEAGWAELQPFEITLESVPTGHLIATLKTRGEVGTLSSIDTKALVAWLEILRQRAKELDEKLRAEQEALEKELPQSLVEVTKVIETARRLQNNWVRLSAAEGVAKEEMLRENSVARVKAFLDAAASAFADAEAAMSKTRLAAVEPLCQTFFSKMSFFGVVPAVSKKASGEELTIRLSKFYDLENLSPQALLSESFRNAFAISMYLAAASLYGGLPKFIILDDVTSSFDAGHQHYLVELLRSTFGRPANPTGPQVILLSHDTMLEKLFNKHSNSGIWAHQRLEGTPQFVVLPQAGAVNKVRDHTIAMLQSGQADFAKEGVRQYLEYKLSELISRLRIPVPVDVAFSESKQLSGDFLQAIDAAVRLHGAANSLVLEPAQVSGLNANMMTMMSNFVSHWGTGQTLAFSAQALLGVMKAIDDYWDCFTFEPSPGAPRKLYASLSKKQ